MPAHDRQWTGQNECIFMVVIIKFAIEQLNSDVVRTNVLMSDRYAGQISMKTGGA
jgi:hypothetical protein